MGHVKKPPGIAGKPAESTTILSISPIDEDHVALKRIFSRSDMELDLAIHAMFELESALPVLRDNRIAIVLSERDLSPGTWRDVLDEIVTFPDPPLLIVTSKLADEYLWAEALNLGAFDVLAKPFHIDEVNRTLGLAWRHWQGRHGIHRKRTEQRVASAA
jgi:DNA-binding response OmpR family regulator